MKKGLLYIVLAALSLQGCRKDDDKEEIQLTIAEQNALDDAAIVNFMEAHYLDSRGNVKKFDANSTVDDNEPNLTTYSPVTLPSGVVYIMRPNAQPTSGKTIGDTDIIEIMGTAYSYLASENEDGEITLGNQKPFMNTINNGGNVYVDPFFYYAKESDLTSNDVSRSYYEIEGFQEGIRKFKSFEIPEYTNYNLQGVILVPSRAAYARDENVLNSSSYQFEDRSFMFNFQVYKTTERP